MAKKIAVIAEHTGREIRPVTFELISLATKIRDLETETCRIHLFILGEGVIDMAIALDRDLNGPAGISVQPVSALGYLPYNGFIFIHALASLFDPTGSGKTEFDYICAANSTSGMDFAPALAVSLGGACITGVVDALREGHGAGPPRICFARPIHGGKVSAVLAGRASPLVITIQAGTFKPCSPKKAPRPPGKEGPPPRARCDSRVTARPASPHFSPSSRNRMVHTGTRLSPSHGSDLGRADVIVSGGRGIGTRENFAYIERLAGLFSRSATGGSRPVCDYGWVSYSKQVGMTGSAVAPKLYIACGISGAAQHVEGVRDSGFIVAINSDPNAPIFAIADVCIVEDLIEFIPLFVRKAERRRAKPHLSRK